jgi:DNA-binding MarR family transcriptional regulator
MNDLIKALRVFKDLDPDATVSTLLAFCYIKRDGYTHVADIISQTGFDKSTVSRQLAVLSNIGRGKKKGLDLLRIHEDPSDRRYKIVNLTDKGRKVMEELSSFGSSHVVAGGQPNQKHNGGKRHEHH